MTKPRKHGSDKNHAQRSTRIQKRLNDELKPKAANEFHSYCASEDAAIKYHCWPDQMLARKFYRSLYAIRARRKRLKQIK